MIVSCLVFSAILFHPGDLSSSDWLLILLFYGTIALLISLFVILSLKILAEFLTEWCKRPLNSNREKSKIEQDN